jgi:hypothetical protein
MQIVQSERRTVNSRPRTFLRLELWPDVVGPPDLAAVDSTTQERKSTMDENTFQRKMSDLIERIRDIPAEDQTASSAGANENSELRLSVTELQESLDYLRLSVKYLVFDLEATRRENAYLRRLVEQSNQRRNEQCDQDSEDDFE